MVHTAQTSGTDPSDEFLTHVEHTICLSEEQLLTNEAIGDVWWTLSVEIKPQEYQAIQNLSWKKESCVTQANLGTS